MTHNNHKGLRLAIITFTTILFAVVIISWCMFGTQLVAANSVRKLDNGLYAMEYKGDYGFDAFIAQGGADSDSRMANYIASFLSRGFWKNTENQSSGDFGCSTLAVRSFENSALFGRNYDWENCDVMIVHTVPSNGYESISTCCLNFLGFGDGWKPEGMGNQMLSLASVYVPLDGMNEKGFCIADLMAGDKAETHQRTEKPDLTTTAAIRLLLDRAATVDEAINLLYQYDMNSAIGSAHHYAMMDSSGRSVVVDYINDEMVITETPVVTNFYLAAGEKNGVGSEQSHIRYERLTKSLLQSNGNMTLEQVRDALASVAQSTFPDSDEGTQWSLNYDTKNLTAVFYLRESFETGYTLSLKSGGEWLKLPE